MILKRQAVMMITVLSLILIGNGCFLQPVNEIRREYNYIDMDAPALRIAQPVHNVYLLKKIKTEDGKEKWVSIGKGTIPAGAYIKGRAPMVEKIEEKE